MIVIVNYHGQYVHRIWRSLKYLDTASEIMPLESSIGDIMAKDPKGIILSGGPYSVFEDKDKLGGYQDILELDVPILGLCLGHQLIALNFGGKVKQGDSGEYAAVDIEVLEEDGLFKGLPKNMSVWESHRDEVVQVPDHFRVLARSEVCAIEAMRHVDKPIYGIQFHPEVEHTPNGAEILRNFIDMCV